MDLDQGVASAGRWEVDRKCKSAKLDVRCNAVEAE